MVDVVYSGGGCGIGGIGDGCGDGIVVMVRGLGMLIVIVAVMSGRAGEGDISYDGSGDGAGVRDVGYDGSGDGLVVMGVVGNVDYDGSGDGVVVMVMADGDVGCDGSGGVGGGVLDSEDVGEVLRGHYSSLPEAIVSVVVAVVVVVVGDSVKNVIVQEIT